MKLSAQEEYGLRCLLRLGPQGDGGSLTIPEISRTEGISPEYVAKLMRTTRFHVRPSRSPQAKRSRCWGAAYSNLISANDTLALSACARIRSIVPFVRCGKRCRPLWIRC